ncbi:MAG TPA: DUF2892 domain-containing protein [Candidatus Thermoplasmatota archaeon]|nr:DUF2892 domain-containing protein [Candidatus Thermoplasmatota archaeon]
MLVKERHRNVGGLERAVRFAVGSLLLQQAVRNREHVGAALTTGALGADLLGTAVTGYCPMNAALGRDSYHA